MPALSRYAGDFPRSRIGIGMPRCNVDSLMIRSIQKRAIASRDCDIKSLREQSDCSLLRVQTIPYTIAAEDENFVFGGDHPFSDLAKNV